MAIPDQVQVPSGTHTQRFVPSGFVANSVSVLNPNNGVCFVARNRDCISNHTGAWDWKVPSQSYAYLPGPFQSVGLYYQDQSGAAIPGDISTYASEQKFDLPVFQAIGLTLASVVTTLDIGMGNAPVPPTVNNLRLWADGSGNLHTLSSAGVDKIVIDSSNIGAQTLGGDLQGSISNGHVVVRNASNLAVLDGAGTYRNFVTFGTEELFWDAMGGGYRWVNQGNTVQWAALNAGGFSLNSGNLNVGGGTNSAGAYLVVTSRVGPQISLYDAGGGNFFGFGINSGELSIVSPSLVGFRLNSNSGARNLYFDVTTGNSYVNSSYANAAFLAGALTFNVSGAAYVIQVPNPNNALYWDQTSLWQVSSNGNPGTFRFYTPQAGRYFDFHSDGAGRVVLGGTDTYFMCPQFIINGSSYAYISLGRSANELAANVHLYVPGNIAYAGSIGPASTIRVKKNLVAIEPANALALVLDPRASSYFYEPIEAAPENSYEADPKRIGFIAEEMLDVVPEVVILDAEGLPASMDYTQLVPLLWGSVRALATRVSALEAPV